MTTESSSPTESAKASDQPIVLALAAKETVDSLLHEIDGIARESCNYDYGLPMYEEGATARMREAVYRFLGSMPLNAKYFHSASIDGRSIAYGVQTMEELREITSS